MEIYVSNDTNNPRSKVGADVTIIHGNKYYVDCLVWEATPAPTIQIAIDGDDSLSEDRPSIFSDRVSANNMSVIQTASQRFSLTADFATHCNKVLSCTARNEANVLINDHDSVTAVDQEKSVKLIVHGKRFVFTHVAMCMCDNQSVSQSLTSP